MKSYLTNNQKKAFEKFSKLKVGALFMEMGTGKTLTTIELIKYNAHKIDFVIWFTPFSTKKNLEKELNKWDYKKKIIIFGWETLSQSDKSYLDLLNTIKHKKIFIVADESIFIKNQDTNRYKRLKEISKNSEYRLILNGTPLTKNEWDIYYQMSFLSHKIINMSEGEFLTNFYKKIDYKKSGDKKKSFYKLSDVNIDYLHKLIKPYIFKVDFKFDKKEVEKIILISPNEKTKNSYNDIKKNDIKNFNNFKSENVIKLLNKLNVISSTDENKAREISKFVENKQIIVFCNYKEEIKSIERNLNNCLTITGDTPQIERDVILNTFELNNKPLLMTLGTGAFGLNLQFCNKIVFSSLTFDYSKVIQAKARIKRIGQVNDIEYVYFDVDLPINNYISKNLDKKKYLNDLIIKKIKEDHENI